MLTRFKWIGILVVFLTAIIFLTACEEKDPLIGKWSEPNTGIMIEFDEEGGLTVSNEKMTVAVTYERKDANALLVKASSDGTIPDQTWVYRIEEDKLIVTVDELDAVFNRVK